MKQKTLEIHPNGVAVARLYNRRITVADKGDLLWIMFEHYAPGDEIGPAQTANRGIKKTVITISKEAGEGLMQAINEVLNQ